MEAKFIKTINSLNQTELKSFGVWLRSPFHNSNKNLIRLFDKLKKYAPGFDSKNLTKKRLYNQIFPGKKFNEHQMNKLLSEAYLQAEKFLIFRSLEQNENLQKELLTKEFQNRGLENWFFKTAEREIERLENKKIKDWEDHLDLLHLNRRIYHHSNQNPRMLPGSPTIVKMNEHLDSVYLLEKAAIINEKIFRNRILRDENHDIELDLKKWLTISEGTDSIALEFYKRRFAYTEENILNEYYRLRELFFERFEELNKKEQKIHLMSLINDSVFLRKKKLIDISELFPLYKLGLDTNILLHKNSVTHITFATIIAVSNAARDFEFSERFKEKYSKLLPEAIRSDAGYWATAHINYKRGNLQRALEILLARDFKSQYFQRTGKILNLQTYFDLYLRDDSYYFYLLNYCNSFERWILREKSLSDIAKKSYYKFIQKVRLLVKYHSEIEFPEEKITNLLKDENYIEAINWLSSKQEEILKLKKK